MRKIKSSYNYGRTGKHGLKRRSKSKTNGAFGKPYKKTCKRCGIRLSSEEERSGFDLCELCRDQNLKDGYPQNFLHRIARLLTFARIALFASSARARMEHFLRGRPTGRPPNSFHIMVNELFLIIKNRVKNASVKKA